MGWSLRKRATVNPAVATSRNSYDWDAEIRKDDLQPDFVVCKAAADGSTKGDEILVLWELKRDDKASSSNALQKARYDDWILDYQWKRFVVYLVKGRVMAKPMVKGRPVLVMCFLKRSTAHSWRLSSMVKPFYLNMT